MIVQTLPRSHPIPPIPIPYRFPYPIPSPPPGKSQRPKIKTKRLPFHPFHSNPILAQSHHPTPMPVRHSSKKEVKPSSSQVNTLSLLPPSPPPKFPSAKTLPRRTTRHLHRHTPPDTRLSLPPSLSSNALARPHSPGWHPEPQRSLPILRACPRLPHKGGVPPSPLIGPRDHASGLATGSDWAA